MIITICASVDFSPKIIELKNELEKGGHTVNIPYFTEKIISENISYKEYMAAKEKNGGDILLREAEKFDMIKRYWDFIRNSDAILVFNMEKKGIENYIGGSTLMEMGFAYGHNKKIFLLNDISEGSEKMHYIDEIIDMHPIFLKGNLNNLKI